MFSFFPSRYFTTRYCDWVATLRCMVSRDWFKLTYSCVWTATDTGIKPKDGILRSAKLKKETYDKKFQGQRRHRKMELCNWPSLVRWSPYRTQNCWGAAPDRLLWLLHTPWLPNSSFEHYLIGSMSLLVRKAPPSSSKTHRMWRHIPDTPVYFRIE